MQVNFRTITKKELFMLMLKHSELDFGYIPKWHRRKFIRFLKKYQLLLPYSFTNMSPSWSWKVTHDFTYRTTWVEMGGLPFRWIAEFGVDLIYGETNDHIVSFSAQIKPKRKAGFDYTIINGDIVYT